MSHARAVSRSGTNAVHIAGMALVIAAVVAGIGAVIGGTALHVLGAVAYIAIAVSALFAPAMIMVQVAAGQVMIAGLLLRPGAAGALLRPDSPGTLLLVAMFVGVVATAELLAVVDRVVTSVDHDPRDDLRRAALAAAVAGVAFGVVLLPGSMPGPTGLAGVALASAACVIVALVLAGRR
jgi:hypothetical protein